MHEDECYISTWCHTEGDAASESHVIAWVKQGLHESKGYTNVVAAFHR